MARDYQPATARFGALDPLGDGYRYVSGRPTVLIDPEGLCGLDPWDASGGSNCFDSLARTLAGDNQDTLLGALAYNTSTTLVNFGRGVSGGLTDAAANSFVNGASCTVDSSSLTARAAQGLGFAATFIGGGQALKSVAGGIGWAGSRIGLAGTASRITTTAATQYAKIKTTAAVASAVAKARLAQALNTVRSAASSALPEALTLGRNAETGVDVYTGVRGGKDVYVGITNNLERRAAQHGDRFVLQQLTRTSVTRGEARAIEQAMLARNPGFENAINSISPSHPWYQQAVDWGETWLQNAGL
jgi:hypothetical protein